METYVALLRGINVGGKNILPMKDLLSLFDKSGCSNCRNYIQSGNVVFCASPKLVGEVPALIARAVKKKFGFEVPVIVRSADELASAAKKVPFKSVGEEQLHIAFLASAPSSAQIALLDAKRSPGDTFKVVGREIYLHLPNGVGKSKLTNQYFDSKLSTVSTIRNWKTLLKLIEMSAG